jgi:hypothetical protein
MEKILIFLTFIYSTTHVGHTLASFCLIYALLSLDDLDALAMPTYILGRGCVYVLIAIRPLLSHSHTYNISVPI